MKCLHRLLYFGPQTCIQSPLIAADGTLVGLVFDGNIHSIAGSYWFDQSVNRTVAVDTAIILGALADAYKADELVAGLSIVDAR